jgi:predicted RNA binding protein YcfA (HicA-like mRNA interferase family)
MSSAEVIRRLKAEGWYLAGSKGAHMRFKHSERGGHVIVPHPRKHMAIHALRCIFRQANWPWVEGSVKVDAINDSLEKNLSTLPLPSINK